MENDRLPKLVLTENYPLANMAEECLKGATKTISKTVSAPANIDHRQWSDLAADRDAWNRPQSCCLHLRSLSSRMSPRQKRKERQALAAQVRTDSTLWLLRQTLPIPYRDRIRQSPASLHQTWTISTLIFARRSQAMILKPITNQC